MKQNCSILRRTLKISTISILSVLISNQCLDQVQAASLVEIPLATVLKPAGDLIGPKGEKLTYAELMRRAKAGEDLSKFNPAVDIFWQGEDQRLSAVDEESKILQAKIQSTGGVRFKAHIGGTRELGLYSIFVEDKTQSSVEDKTKSSVEDKTNRYQLTFGTQVHTSLVRAALLRKLGYFQNSPVFFKEIQIDFESAQEKQEFKETAFCRKIEGGEELISDKCIAIDPELGPENPRTEPMIVEMPGTNSLKIRSAYIERLTAKVPSLFNGVTPATINNVETYGINRTFRSILVPFAVADLEEGLERVDMETFRLVDGKGYLRINFGSDFRNTDYYDVKWMLRKMTRLTKKDWDEVVQAGQYPDQCLNQMAYNALVTRFRSSVQWANQGYIASPTGVAPELRTDLLGIAPEILNAVNYNYSCGDLVEQGRLKKDFIQGSPIRFSHGLRPSPWGKGDPRRLAIILMQSGLLRAGLNKLSENLKSTRTSVKPTDKIVLTPQGPQKLVRASSVEKGFAIDGGRSINTGTLLGSNAPVQLVDTLAISASVSSMKQKLLDADAWTGAALIRSTGLKGRVIREFTYVEPIGSMKQAQERSILDVLKTDSKLEKIAKVLEKGGVSEFLQAMQPNEVFIVTDTIALEGVAGMTQALDAMRVFGRLTNPTISIGVSGAAAVVGQTIISRTNEGLQVVVRDLDPKKNRRISAGFNISVNAFINFLSLERKTDRLWYDTEVYPIAYNPSVMLSFCDKFFVGLAGYPETTDDIDCTGKLDPDTIDDEKRKARLTEIAQSQKKFERVLMPALKELIYDSDLDLFREKGGELQKRLVQIKNKVKTTTDVIRAFWNRQVMVHEDQVVSVFDPVLKDGSRNPGKPIEIAVSTRGSLRGEDKVGFGLNVFDAVIREKFGETGFMLSQNILNPAGMPKGMAEWRLVETQSEISSQGGGENQKLPSQATLRYIWGGWKITQTDLNEIIEQINKRTPRIELEEALAQHREEHGFSLIPDGVFNRVESIDFYRISINLKIREEGLKNLIALVLDPTNPVPRLEASAQEKMNWFNRFSARLKRANQKLNERLSGKYRAADQVVYNNIIELYGRDQYIAECLIEKSQKNDMNGVEPQEMLAGTTYPCLADWLNRLIQISRRFDVNNVRQTTAGITEVLYVLDEKLPIQALLGVIGKSNYNYGVNVLGFRAKDQNADQSNWVGPIFGEPNAIDQYRDGLLGFLAERSKVHPLFLNATQIGF